MEANPEILVTLSDELMAQLRRVAQREHVPLRWLVVGLVCDTFKSAASTPRRRCRSVADRAWAQGEF